MKKILLGTVALAALGLAAPAIAADLPAKAPIYVKAPVIAPAFSWQRCYIGAHAGYGWGTSDWDFYPVSFSTGGFLAGGQAGCNWQPQRNLVVGIEGEVWWSNISGGTTYLGVGSDALTSRNRWDADIALRLGFAADRTLFYVKGGGAYGNFSYSDAYTTIGTALSTGTSDRFGWLIGAGIEHALDHNWTIKIEYNYIDFGRKNVVLTAPTDSYVPGIRETKNIVKVGVNYLFGGPVVAKY